MSAFGRSLSVGVFAGVGVLLISLVRGSLADTFHTSKVRNDVYPLPPPSQTLVLSLGYRAALADVLFAHLLVSHGLHFQEKRLHEFVGNYLETINELDPKFRTPYLLADTLLTLQPVAPPLRHYKKAREILERGMRELPHDAELHINAGQYLLYLGVGAIKDEKEQEEWRQAGARALAQACEVMGDQKNLPFHCIHAAAMLEKAGKRGAMTSFVRKVLSVVDDPEIREKALRYLEFAEGEEQREKATQRFVGLAAAQAQDVPFVSRDFYLLLPPRFDALGCAGDGHSDKQACATSWRDWSERAPLPARGETHLK